MADRDLTIPDQAIPYILYQRTAYLSARRPLWYRLGKKLFPALAYRRLVDREARSRPREIHDLFIRDMQEEYRRIRDALPDSPLHILDIGCGVAAINLFLFRHYRQSPRTHFHLLDKTSTAHRVYYGFKSQGAFYNSLAVARELLIQNGVPAENIHLMEVTPDLHIPVATPLDLVISLLSWGHHYPVETYLNQVHDRLASGGRLILDIRHGTDGDKPLRSKFAAVTALYEAEKFTRFLAVK